jgi:hypothetical protein
VRTTLRVFECKKLVPIIFRGSVRYPKRMDIAWLKDLSKEFGGVGLGPTPQELIAMQCSVPVLADQQGHDVSHFWGKLTGPRGAT